MVYELHVFGLNLAAQGKMCPRPPSLTRKDADRLLSSLARSHASLEAVVVLARNHVEAFVAAPSGQKAVRAWVAQLRRVRPDLTEPALRGLHYHLAGEAAECHLGRVASGRLAATPAAAVGGIKAALGLAARCGTLGETLDGLFVRAMHPERAGSHPLPFGAAR